MLASIGQCIGTGHPDLLRHRLIGLSDRQLAADPSLALAAAWLALMTGDVDSLGTWLAVVEERVGPDWQERASGDPLAAGLAMIHALVAPGSLARMADLAGSALLGLPRDSAFRPAAAFLHGVALTLARDLDGGMASLKQAVQLARAAEIPVSEADSLAWLGIIAIIEGNRAAGFRQIMRAAALGREHHLDRLSTGAHSLTAEAFALALQHDLPAAERTLAVARRQTVALGDIAPWFAVCGRILQARTAMLLGDGATARLLLAEVRTLMTPDLRDSLAQDLLDETESALRTLAVDGVSADALTTAELRVLQFLPSHLTFRQIGEHLFLSQNTVKTHALSIYRKLGVSSRDESVVRARSLGLVDSPSAGLSPALLHPPRRCPREQVAAQHEHPQREEELHERGERRGQQQEQGREIADVGDPLRDRAGAAPGGGRGRDEQRRHARAERAQQGGGQGPAEGTRLGGELHARVLQGEHGLERSRCCEQHRDEDQAGPQEHRADEAVLGGADLRPQHGDEPQERDPRERDEAEREVDRLASPRILGPRAERQPPSSGTTLRISRITVPRMRAKMIPATAADAGWRTRLMTASRSTMTTSLAVG